MKIVGHCGSSVVMWWERCGKGEIEVIIMKIVRHCGSSVGRRCGKGDEKSGMDG